MGCRVWLVSVAPAAARSEATVAVGTAPVSCSARSSTLDMASAALRADLP